MRGWSAVSSIFVRAMALSARVMEWVLPWAPCTKWAVILAQGGVMYEYAKANSSMVLEGNSCIGLRSDLPARLSRSLGLPLVIT